MLLQPACSPAQELQQALGAGHASLSYPPPPGSGVLRPAKGRGFKQGLSRSGRTEC